MLRTVNRWKDQLTELESLVIETRSKLEKGEGVLRFHRPFVMASDIAGQYFCEKKVEMRYLHGEIETARKTLGTEAHEKLLEGTIKIKREELWRTIYGKEPVLVSEMLLISKYRNLILVGRPDAVFFYQGHPLFIFEYKFSKSRRPFRDHHVQAKTYGILLRNMGFNTDRLMYVIVMAEPKAKNSERLRNSVIETTVKNGQNEGIIDTENAKIYVNKFDYNDAERDLEWALGFWIMQRDAIPTRNQNKCRSCEYGRICVRDPLVERPSHQT